ncbi:mucin-5AC-like isoform X2 [Pomacea canaliculata]|nr:mucin-5AC-like isoform X2 [Pomacea canaliculata]XP_025093895.1 mucin-5AC-like isoform X2 [Pomacea canaliculata]
MENKRSRLRISELNPHLLCALCGGYLIDATTIVECLHSFCKTCIVRYLETSNYCPICEVLIHKKRPWQNIRLDHTLQNAVYKVVPGLFRNEMQRRRDYYEKHPPPGGKDGFAEQVHTAPERIIFSEDEKFSVTLEFSPNGRPIQEPKNTAVDVSSEHRDKRFLLCPASLRVGHLKKFVRLKYSLPECYTIDLFYSDEPLDDEYSLMDVAYIYSWRRESVLTLYYSFYEPPSKRRKVAAATATSQDALPARVSSPRPSTPAKAEPASTSSSTISSKSVEAVDSVSGVESSGVKTAASPHDVTSRSTATTDVKTAASPPDITAPSTVTTDSSSVAESRGESAKQQKEESVDDEGENEEEDEERPLIICTPEPLSLPITTFVSAIEAEVAAIKSDTAKDHPTSLHAGASGLDARLCDTEGERGGVKVGASSAFIASPVVSNSASSVSASAVNSTKASHGVNGNINCTAWSNSTSVCPTETAADLVIASSRSAKEVNAFKGSVILSTTSVGTTSSVLTMTSSAVKMSPSRSTSGASHTARPQSPLGIFDRIYSVTSNCSASGIKSIFKSTSILSANSTDRRNSIGSSGGGVVNKGVGSRNIASFERRSSSSSVGVQSVQHGFMELAGKDRRPSLASAPSRSDLTTKGEERGMTSKISMDSNADRPASASPQRGVGKSEKLEDPGETTCSSNLPGGERRLATNGAACSNGTGKISGVSSPPRSAASNRRPGTTTLVSGSSDTRTSSNNLSSVEVERKPSVSGGGDGGFSTGSMKRADLASPPSSQDYEKHSSRAVIGIVQNSDVQVSRPTLASVCRAVTISVDGRFSAAGGAEVTASTATAAAPPAPSAPADVHGGDGESRCSADTSAKQKGERHVDTPLRTCPDSDTGSQESTANRRTIHNADRRLSNAANTVNERRLSGGVNSGGDGKGPDSAAQSSARTGGTRDAGTSSSVKQSANGNVMASRPERAAGHAASEARLCAAGSTSSPSGNSPGIAEERSESENSGVSRSRSPNFSSTKSHGTGVSTSSKAAVPKNTSSLTASDKRPSGSSTQNRIFTSKTSGGSHPGAVKRSYNASASAGSGGSVHRTVASPTRPQAVAGVAASGSTSSFTRITSTSVAATGASDPKRMKTSGSGPAFSNLSPSTVISPTILSSSSAATSNCKTSSRIGVGADKSSAATGATSTSKTAFSSNVGSFPNVGGSVYKKQTLMNQMGPSGTRLPAPGTRVDSLLFRATNKTLVTSSATAPAKQDGGGSAGREDRSDTQRGCRGETEVDSRVSFFDKTFSGGKSNKETCVSSGVGGSDISFSARHILSNAFHSYGSSMAKKTGCASTIANNNNTTTNNKNNSKLSAGMMARNASVACDLTKKSSTASLDSTRSNGIARKSEVTTTT